MCYRIAIIVLMIVAYSPVSRADETPPSSDTPIRQSEVDAARERIVQLLAEANVDGVVQLKKYSHDAQETQDANTHDTHEAAQLTAEQANKTPAPETIAQNDGSLQETPPAPVICIDNSLYSAERASITDVKTIRELQSTASITEGTVRRDIEHIVAWSYLHLGFYSEAASLARQPKYLNDSQFQLIVSLAKIGQAQKIQDSKTLDQFAHCSDALELFQVVGLISQERATLEDVATLSPEILTHITPALAAPAAESIALYALNAGDKPTALAFYEIAQTARTEEGSPALTILRTAFDGSQTVGGSDKKTLTDLAHRPGPLQDDAVAALVTDINAEGESAYDGLIEDLTNLETGVPNDNAAISGATALINNGRVADAIDLLIKSGEDAGTEENPLVQHARQTIENLISQGTSEQKYAALSAYLHHRNKLAGPSITPYLSLIHI